MPRNVIFVALLLVLIGTVWIVFDALTALGVGVGAIVAFVVISGLNNPHMDDDET
ncbi:hypothetical protein [Nereida ignava]|jgi:hypothetical protein|uniref:hypothetical protein n=1 Tax=Nereida ignava TaxID=282199 RepID=UPI0030FC4D05